MEHTDERTVTRPAGSSSARLPRAIVHKRILEVARSRPEATMDELASEVGAATTELVERVLDEYGDPAEEGPAEADSEAADGDDPGMADAEGGERAGLTSDGGSPVEEPADADEAPDAESFTDAQRETLRAIHDRPEATQADLAARFDITTASISQRVNSIDGFDWATREAFTEAVFEAPAGEREGAIPAEPDGGAAPGAESDGPDSEHTTGAVGTDDPDGSPSESSGDSAIQEAPALADQLDVLSARVDRLERRRGQSASSVEPALVHKVAHACLQSEAISEDEELRILEALLASRD